MFFRRSRSLTQRRHHYFVPPEPRPLSGWSQQQLSLQKTRLEIVLLQEKLPQPEGVVKNDL